MKNEKKPKSQDADKSTVSEKPINIHISFSGVVITIEKTKVKSNKDTIKSNDWDENGSEEMFEAE
jgi:hypothetical protein